jgi:hypothetical protein
MDEMSKPFDERVIDAVRATGPDALTSQVWLEMDGGEIRLWGTSLGKLMHHLERLAAMGILAKRTVVDEKGRDRSAWSMGTGRMRHRTVETGFGEPSLAMA